MRPIQSRVGQRVPQSHGQVRDVEAVGGDREYIDAAGRLVDLVVDDVRRSNHDGPDHDRMDVRAGVAQHVVIAPLHPCP